MDTAIPVTLLPVTLTFVALLALSLLPLIVWIGLGRARAQMLYGDGDDPVLRRRIGIHRNLLETGPVTALALWGGETLGVGAYWLWIAVASFIFGRVLHAALYDHTRRGISMLFTAAPGFALGATILILLWI